MATGKVNEEYTQVLPIYDFDGITKLTGLASSKFSGTFYKDGGVLGSPPTLTIAEIGVTGDYKISFTPPSTGRWSLILQISDSYDDLLEIREIPLHVMNYDIDDVVGGTGTESLTITVQNTSNSNAGVTGVRLDIFNSGETSLITFGRTNSLGQLTIIVDHGSYKIRGFLPGYSIPVTAVTVTNTSGATAQSATVSVTSATVTAPLTPSVCRIYADIIDQSGSAASDFPIQVINLYDPTNDFGLSVTETEKIHKTNASGHVEFDVVRGIKIRVALVGTSVTRDLTVPDQATANLMTLLGAVSDPFTVTQQSNTFTIVGL